MGWHVNPQRLSWFLAHAYSLWARSLRYELVGTAGLDAALKSGRKLVAALWHDELFALPYIGLRYGYPVAAVVSASRDGEILARTLERMGAVTARGSSHRGGARALVAARKLINAGHVVVITVDGPQGPRHQAKPGAVALAQAAGAVIVPVRLELSRAHQFNSWDRFQLPFPFSRVRISVGQPYEPTGELDAEVARLENLLSEPTNALIHI